VHRDRCPIQRGAKFFLCGRCEAEEIFVGDQTGPAGEFTELACTDTPRRPFERVGSVAEFARRVVAYGGAELTQGLFCIFQEAVDQVRDEIKVAAEFLEFAQRLPVHDVGYDDRCVGAVRRSSGLANVARARLRGAGLA